MSGKITAQLHHMLSPLSRLPLHDNNSPSTCVFHPCLTFSFATTPFDACISHQQRNHGPSLLCGMLFTSNMQFQTQQTVLPVHVSECDVRRVCEVHPLACTCQNIIPLSPNFRRQFLSSLTSSIDYTRLSYSKLSFSMITFPPAML